MPRYVPKTWSQEVDERFEREVAGIIERTEAVEGREEDMRRLRLRMRDVDPYAPRSPHSYFQDRAAVAVQGMPNPEAEERLNRHRSATEKRAVSTAALGGIVPTLPGWILQAIETAVHKTAPLYAALEKIPLPEQGTTIQFVKFTAGAAAAAQSSENAALSTQDPASSTDAEPFSTVATYVDASFATRDRSGGLADLLIAQDLGQAYGEKVESELWVGTGSSGRIRGLTQASPTTSVAAGGQTLPQNLGALFNCFQQSTMALGHAPDILAVHPRRAAWLRQAVAGAPAVFVPPGVELVESPQAPSSLGGGSEDWPFFISRAAVPLATDGPQVSVHEQATGNALTARFVVRGYLAFASAARPEGMGKVTALTTPTFS
jgi:hypothetical protein